MDIEEMVFENIQNVTMSILEPFYASVPSKLETAVLVLHDWNKQTSFLVLKNKRRVVFYVVSLPFGFSDLGTDTSTCTIPIGLSARRVEATEATIDEMLAEVDESSIEDLPTTPMGAKESEREFYERNALWLLNPPIH